MAFTRIDDDMDIIQKLDDEPNDVGGLTAAELKEEFDSAGNIMKQRVNRLMTELEAAPSAHSIGFTSTEAIAKNNVQDAIEAVQTNLESTEQTLSDSINNALMGQIPDRSLEARKLKQKTITGNEIADGTITAAKFAEGTTVAGWEELSIADVGLHISSGFTSIVAIDTAHTYFRYSRTMGIMLFRVAVRDIRAHNDTMVSVIQDYYKPAVPGSQGVSCAVDGLFHSNYLGDDEFNSRLIRAKMSLSDGSLSNGVFSYSIPVHIITNEAISSSNRVLISGWYLCGGRGDE